MGFFNRRLTQMDADKPIRPAHAGNAVEPAPAPSPESFRGEVRDTVRTLLERRRAQGGTPGGHR